MTYYVSKYILLYYLIYIVLISGIMGEFLIDKWNSKYLCPDRLPAKKNGNLESN